MDRSRDGPLRAVLVAVAVCSVCSLVVSSAVVLLRPQQLAHQERERKAHIFAILQSLPGLGAQAEAIDPRDLEEHVVDLATGTFDESIDPRTFDARRAAAEPDTSVEIPGSLDQADLGRRARHAVVYLLRRDARIQLLILPVHGAGFLSTLYGYLALDGDTNTIRGLTFYEQAETPGLGGQVADPAWLARWRGKQVRDQDGRLRIEVVGGEVSAGDPDAAFSVDGITGATYTGDGVTALLQYWLGEHGFEPLLRRLRQEREES